MCNCAGVMIYELWFKFDDLSTWNTRDTTIPNTRDKTKNTVNYLHTKVIQKLFQLQNNTVYCNGGIQFYLQPLSDGYHPLT